MTHNNRGRLAVDLGGAWRIWWGNAPLPAGAQALGTIARDSDTGALILLAAGNYSQGNAGALRALDQRKVAAALSHAAPGHGGARRGGGRQTADGAQGVIRKNVTLDVGSIDKLRALGGGDLSLGIRRAAAKL